MLSQALRSQNIVVNAICPGWVKTDMGGDSAPRTPEQGADTAVWLATEAPGNETGKYWRDRKVISFDYKGGRRYVEPFTLGRFQSTQKDMLVAWFLRGYSESGQGETWRTYSCSQLTGLQVHEESAAAHRPGYTPRDSRMDLIYCTA